MFRVQKNCLTKFTQWCYDITPFTHYLVQYEKINFFVENLRIFSAFGGYSCQLITSAYSNMTPLGRICQIFVKNPNFLTDFRICLWTQVNSHWWVKKIVAILNVLSVIFAHGYECVQCLLTMNAVCSSARMVYLFKKLFLYFSFTATFFAKFLHFSRRIIGKDLIHWK